MSVRLPGTGFRIRILMDPYSSELLDPDPDPKFKVFLDFKNYSKIKDRRFHYFFDRKQRFGPQNLDQYSGSGSDQNFFYK